jgi:hypothetical protein
MHYLRDGLGLPRLGWVNAVVEHPRNPDLLFVGTETGLFVTFDRGGKWLRMTGDFPTVPVDDLVIHPRENDLVVGTHGRSIYILDDVTALERHREGGDSVELFELRKATVFLPWKHESYGAQRQFVGENPEFGALVTYHLGRPVEGVEIRIADAESSCGSSGTGGLWVPAVVWDLGAEGPKDVPREKVLSYLRVLRSGARRRLRAGEFRRGRADRGSRSRRSNSRSATVSFWR